MKHGISQWHSSSGKRPDRIEVVDRIPCIFQGVQKNMSGQFGPAVVKGDPAELGEGTPADLLGKERTELVDRLRQVRSGFAPNQIRRPSGPER